MKCIRIRANSLYLSLHPSAACIGNIVSIPRISWSTFCRIQRLIERPELESVRHWRVCFDLPRPLLTNKSIRHCIGRLSYKMPSSTHELLAQFASKLQAKMWNEGSQDSFYPPDVRHEEYFISNSGSAGKHCTNSPASLLSFID